MPTPRMWVVGALLVAAAASTPAAAATQVVHDSAGRPITFDVRAGGADVPGYAAILDGLQHGDEISSVVITIVPSSSIPLYCGDGDAVACYRWSSDGDAAMFVPAVPAAQVRGPLIHEYGHHVDATRPHVAGARGLDGTPSWWRARGIADRLARGEVAWDYSLGWDRSIAEIYAEDYAAVNGGGRSGIRWLGDPPPDVQAAVRADLPGAVAPPAPPAPAPPPPPQPAATGANAAPLAAATVVARQAGRLAAGRRAHARFRLAARHRLVVRLGGVTGRRVRAVVRCGGRPRTGGVARRGRPAVLTVRAARGRCRVTVRALGQASRYRLLVRARAL